MKEEAKKYLYLLEIDSQEHEIIIVKCQRLLWTLIPFSDEAFEEVLNNFPGYDVYELDERFLRWQTDRKSYMNPN